MRRISLRTALLAPVVLALLLGTVSLGIFLERSVRGDLVEAIDDELTRVITDSRLRAGPRDNPGGQAPPAADERTNDAATGVPVQFAIRPDGTVEPLTPTRIPFDEATIEALRDTARTTTVDGTPSFRVMTETTAQGSTDVAALSLAAVEDSTASLRRNLVLGGLGVFVVQTLAVWFVASRVARPVRRLSDAATRIADGELDTNLGRPEGTTETVVLAEDLEAMLTRLRRTIDDRARAAEDAERSREDMQRFLADASHELRTPLTALKGYSDLYAAGMLADEEALDRAMERVGSESDRMNRLVGDMLSSVRRHDHLEHVDVRDVCASVVDDLRAAHPDRSIGFESGDQPIVVMAGRDRLHQAVLNLGSNACHHTPVETRVDVRAFMVDGTAVIEVSDDGPGIPVAELDAIFRPFVRGDASRSRRSHDGAGLGLAIVQRVADEHGGRVRVDSQVGEGAVFRIELPNATPPR